MMSRRSKTILFVVSGAIVLSCGLCGGCFVQSFRELPKVQAAAESFMDQLKAAQIDEAYAATAPDFKAATGLEGFRAELVRFPALTKQDSRSMGGCRIFNGNQAQVGYSIVSPPNAVTMSLTLGKVDGGWKVSGLHVP
jgi:hypothetical protein